MLRRLRTRIAGDLRLKASLLVDFILVPLLGLYIWYDVQQQGGQFEKTGSAKSRDHGKHGRTSDFVFAGKRDRDQPLDP